MFDHNDSRDFGRALMMFGRQSMLFGAAIGAAIGSAIVILVAWILRHR